MNPSIGIGSMMNEIYQLPAAILDIHWYVWDHKQNVCIVKVCFACYRIHFVSYHCADREKGRRRMAGNYSS